MTKIKRLSAHEAQKIAAGEVVERPANVVKELLENALDAGAHEIIIHLEDAGKKLIRLIDDGCGMSPEDAALSFEHHATSKIRSIDDLLTLETFGFRGEALSSISSVSNITLITKEESAQAAIKLDLEQGTIVSKEETHNKNGTDIAVRDLFFNIPARKKFLKSTETEMRNIQQLIHALSLAHLAIHFKVFSDGRLILNCPATDDLHKRMLQLWEYDFASHMIPLEIQKVENNGIILWGAISDHQYVRYDRSSLYFFVNSRWVKQQKLSSSLLKGYTNVLPPGRFPAACIFIELDNQAVDVNIHPRKEEVQFLNPRKIEQQLQEAVKYTLESHLSRQLNKKVTFAPATEVIVPQRNPLQFKPSSGLWQPSQQSTLLAQKNISYNAQEYQDSDVLIPQQ